MISRTHRAPWWWLAALASASASAAFGLTLLLRLQRRPFLLPMIAVLFAALRGGLAAGLLCTAITLVLANYFITPPSGQFGFESTSDVYELGVFAATALTISILAARGRRAQLTLEATVSSIADGVIVTDANGQVRFLNSVAERLTGWSNSAAASQPVREIFVSVAEDTQQPLENPVERTLRESQPVDIKNHRMLVSRDGTQHPIADSAAPIHDLNGHVIGAVLVFRDASKQRAAELELRQQAIERQHLLERERVARSDAERANRLKDEFLATLSHELRTPLNAVLGWSHMLTRRQLTSEQHKQALAAIHRNAQAQARLVEDVLDLSRIVTGRMALTSEPVSLADIARSTADSFTPAVMARRQELRLDLAATGDVHGDPHRLRQVIWNLLSNATKFTPDGGVITLSVRDTADRVELAVSDNGEGIEAAFLPFVFDRFRQADSSSTRGHGGLGLGLALVRHLVEAHGGSVSAVSGGLGQGTRVAVSLPTRTDRRERAPVLKAFGT